MLSRLFYHFKTNALLLILFFLSSNTYTQDWGNWDSHGIQIHRMIWFNGQRAYPNQAVPPGSYNYAIKQFMKISAAGGYFAPQEKWTCIGPSPGYMGGNISGRVAAVKFHPDDRTGLTIFVGGADGGIWKTTDGGSSWVAKTDFITSLSSGALAIGLNPSGQMTNIYYGTGESHAGFNFCYYGDGFYKSTDNGETWRQIISKNLPEYPTYFSRIVVRPGHPNELLAACGTNHTNISYESGLYRSTDYGETWLPRVVPPPNDEGRVCNDVVFSPDGSMAYMTGPDEANAQIYEKGVHYRISNDGGATFGPPRDDILKLRGRSHIAISSYDPNRIYILTHTETPCNPGSCSPNSVNASLFASRDAGSSFTKTYDFLQFSCACGGGDAYQSWYDMLLYVSPFNHDIIYAGFINMWKSTDGGLSFFYITPSHTDMQNMDLDINNPDHLALGSDGGMHRSTNGGSWMNLNEGLSLTQIYRIASSPFNPDKVVGGAQDNGIQSKYTNSDDWRDILGGNDGTSVYFSQITPDLLFAGFGNYASGRAPTILRSLNGGVYFTDQFYPPDSYWDAQNDWIPPISSYIVQFPLTEYFLIARRCLITSPSEQIVVRLFRSSDFGATWVKYGDGVAANESPQHIATSSSNPNVMYMSTGSYAWPQTNQKLYKSVDAGLTWSEILNSSSAEVPNRFITHIEVDKSNENLVFITLSGFNNSIPGRPGHIFMTENGGSTWRDISGSLPDIPVNDFLVVYSGMRYYIIGTDAGMLITSDGGESWREPGPELPHAVVTDIEYDIFTGKVRAATFGRSVWEHNLISTSANVNHNLYLNSEPQGLNINNDLIIERGGKLMIPFACTIKMKAGKKIIIEDGGRIEVTSGSTVSFTSQSGKWGGIEIREGGEANIKNCSFDNTDSPVTLKGKGSEPVTITNCTFNKGSIIVVGRNDVTISNSIFRGSSAVTGTSVSGIHCSNFVVSNNKISNVHYSGISVSNSHAIVTGNEIWCDNPGSAYAGISSDNSTGVKLSSNRISNFKQDIFLFNSSPAILEDPYAEVLQDKAAVNLDELIKTAESSKSKTEILSAELNIIELLMLGSEKDDHGRYEYLKPATLQEGVRMINERLFGFLINTESSNSLPEAFSLSQNYPNPFNPVTTIRFEIPPLNGVRGMKVILSIYDMLGKELETIVNSEFAPGKYEARWNAADYSSGVYFYTISVSNPIAGILFNQSAKMLLIK